ncbi:MAG TPA: FAD binding domain-containing protein [Ilumatobacteraceae bacterium]|jgi:CO/xanthine dehydrogenase FAD-binding subunit|nr:FAD binding domain-containing protein [Ilumatobacteraceae bacterium]
MSVLISTTLADALEALAADPARMVLAGGTDVMVEINMGHRRPESVVSVARIPELRTWSHDARTNVLRIGAGITYAELEVDPFLQWVPALSQAARTVGSPQIRHAATIGGNLATCSPAGDGLPVLSALDAIVHLVSATGARSVPFAEFMTGPKRTALLPGELIEAVSMPVFASWQGYAKVGVRNAMVISNAGACLAVDDTGGVRLALGSVGPTIIRCNEAEVFARSVVDHANRTVDDADAIEFGRLAAAASRPIDDHRSTAEYRRHAVAVLARRLLRRAFPNG